MIKKLLLAAVTFMTMTTASAQVRINCDINPDEPFTSSKPVRLANNNRLLTKKGLSLVLTRYLSDIRVRPNNDTIIIKVKPEAMKLLDADKKANYEPEPAKKTDR